MTLPGLVLWGDLMSPLGARKIINTTVRMDLGIGGQRIELILDVLTPDPHVHTYIGQIWSGTC